MKIIAFVDYKIVKKILDDLIEVGFDGIHPQCMDIGEVKEYLKDKTCILGNIDCQELLPSGFKEIGFEKTSVAFIAGSLKVFYI